MNTKTLIPLLTLFVALPVAADQPTLRYEFVGKLQLHMEQDMYPGGDIDLGFVTDGGLHPSSLLIDILPVLPDKPVSIGMSWEITQPVRSLEGWAWAEGSMHYSNEVVDITQSAGHTIVHAKSSGSTAIGTADGTTGFVGEGTLERRFEWAFDANSGRLLSLSLEQEGTGTNQLPQGQVQVRQVTHVELRGS